MAGNFGAAVDPVTGALLEADPTLAATPTGDTNGDGVVDSTDLLDVLTGFNPPDEPGFVPVGDEPLTEAEAAAIEGAFAGAMGVYVEADCSHCTYRPCWCVTHVDDPDPFGETDGNDPPGFDQGGGGPTPPGGSTGGGTNDHDGDGQANGSDCDHESGASTAACDCDNITVKVDIIADTNLRQGDLNDPSETEPVDHDGDEDDPDVAPEDRTPRIAFEDAGQPGLLVLVNDDDDDLDGVADRVQVGPLVGGIVDDELVPVHLQIAPNREGIGQWVVQYNESRFRVWKDRNRTGIWSPGTPKPLPVPLTVYVEAIASSVSPGDSTLGLSFIPNPGVCPEDLLGTLEEGTPRLSDSLKATAVQLEMFDLRHCGPGYDASQQRPFTQNNNLDATGMKVGGAITDGASICLLRVTPPLSEFVDDGIAPREFWEVIDPAEPSGGIEIDIGTRTGVNTYNPDVVGSLYPVERPVDPDGPGPLPMGHWNTVATANVLPELPVIETDPVSERKTSDVQSPDGLWYYVPPEGFRDNDGLHTIPGLVEKATIRFRVRINGQGRGDFDFILRRPPIVLVHGLMGSAVNYWGGYAYSESLGHPLPTRLYYVDYESTNTQGYSENLWTLHHMLEAALDDYRLGRDTTPNHKVAHAPGRGFDEVRYAATRVDVVGHSMGGQIARAYITNLGNTTPPTTNAVIRGGAWAAAVFGRGASPGDSRYISDRNWGAGAFRRFIATGSPFKGSPIGDLVAPHLDPTLRNCRKLAGLKALFPEVSRNSLYRKLFSDPDRLPAPTAYIPPTAVADLSVDSPVQQALEASWRYPIGRRKVPWYALVGVATEPAGQDPIQAVAWELLFTFLRVDSDLTAIEPLNPTNSDLVVSQWSQRNADDENDYPNAQFPSFPFHLHTFGFATQYGFSTETESDFMSHVTGDPARLSVRELLSLPRSHMMIGELH